jgi:hypothetical protein
VLHSGAAAKGLQLAARVDDEVPEALSGDALRIRRVLLARGERRQVHRAGRVEISVEVRQVQGKPVLQFEVLATPASASPPTIRSASSSISSSRTTGWRAAMAAAASAWRSPAGWSS